MTEFATVILRSGEPTKGSSPCFDLERSHLHLVVEIKFFVNALFAHWSLLRRDTNTGSSEARVSIGSVTSHGWLKSTHFDETIIGELFPLVKNKLMNLGCNSLR